MSLGSRSPEVTAPPGFFRAWVRASDRVKAERLQRLILDSGACKAEAVCSPKLEWLVRAYPDGKPVVEFRWDGSRIRAYELLLPVRMLCAANLPHGDRILLATINQLRNV